MAVIVSDTFNRANSATLGNAVTGQPWQIIEGGFQLNANKAEATNGAQNTAVIDSGVSDCTVSADLTSTGNPAMVVFRLTDINNYYKVETRSDGFSVLSKNVGNVKTDLAATTLTYVSGAKMEAVLSGNSIIVKYNGVQIWSVTDTFNQTATKHGIGSWYTETSQDNFNVDGAGAPVGTPGTVSYATKQAINRTASTSYATKQVINRTASTAFATKQAINQVGSAANATKQAINRTASLAYATKQVISQTASLAYAAKQVIAQTNAVFAATKQSIYQIGSIPYATQQTIASGGIPGSVAYSTKQILSQTGAVVVTTKQTVYRVGSIDAATKQAIFVVGSISYPTHQAITDLFYDQTIMFNIPIQRGLKFDAVIKRSEEFEVVITRTKNFNIRL